MSSPLIAGLPCSCEGLNYLVPTKWWNEFRSINKQATSSQSLKVPHLSIIEFADDFLLHYQSQLVESLEQKCLYLNFHGVKINLQINNLVDWTPINPALWKAINKKLKEKNGIISFTNSQNSIDVKKTQQLQLVFCSKTRSQLFVGYIPKQANLISVIRQIGFQMGFVEVTRSKVTFLERSPEVNFSFHQLEKYTVESSPDAFLMMFNMQRREDDEEKHPKQSSFGAYLESKNNSLLMDSNEAVVGDLNTMSNDSNNGELNNAVNRTISTGAQTPFSFALSQGFDLDRQYRVNELFGAKQPEQIEEMKQYATSKINNQKQLIPLPIKSSEFQKSYLEQLAEEALELMSKRKAPKQLEIKQNVK